MAEFDRGSALPSIPSTGTVSLPYVMRTSTPPASVFFVVAAWVVTVYIGRGLLLNDTSQASNAVKIAMFTFVLLPALTALIHNCGPSGRFGKQVTVDGTGVTIKPLMARLNQSLSTHLPAAGLWYLTPDDCVGSLPEQDNDRGDTRAFTRWWWGERRPPAQSRVLVGHDDPGRRWHSLKTTEPQLLVDAVVAVGGVSGREALSPATRRRQEQTQPAAVEENNSIDAWALLGVNLRWFSAGAVAITVALQHGSWESVMLVAAAVPYSAVGAVKLIAGLFSGGVVEWQPKDRLAGFVVGSAYAPTRRGGTFYRSILRLPGPDDEFVDLDDIARQYRCPLPSGSPVPIVVTPSPTLTDADSAGRESAGLHYAEDHHDQSAPLESGLVFFPLCLLPIMIWVLWVADALVGPL